MKNKALAVVCGIRGLPWKSLNVVVDVLRSVRCNVKVESYICSRHDVNVDKDLVVRRTTLWIPTFTVVIGNTIRTNDWEIITN